MKYRLKDRELQKKLDDISNGDFSVCLNNGFSKTIETYGFKNIKAKRVLSVQIDFGEKAGLTVPPERYADKRYSVNLLCGEIEQIKEYNPKTWNEFPEVEPPEDVWMRCVMTDIHHNNRIVRVGAKFSAGAWRDHEGVAFEPRFRVDKFKSWDDEDKE